MAVTYTKLRDGSWGVRATERIRAGDTVTVVKANGNRVSETVGRIVWSDQSVWLASVVKKASKSATKPVSRSVPQPVQREEPAERDWRDDDEVWQPDEDPGQEPPLPEGPEMAYEEYDTTNDADIPW